MRCLPLLLLALSGCRACAPAAAPSPGEASPRADAPLLAEVKQALAERERRLTSYRVTVASTEGGAQARHEFFFRGPNKMRGVLQAPQELTVSYDGVRFFRASSTAKKLEVYDFKLPPEKSAYFLATTFQPFVPEGFRAPLLPRAGVTAAKAKHPRAGEVVEVTARAQDEGGEAVVTTWVLRLPAGDFLGKRTEAGGAVSELSVDEETCDERARLCVPRRLTQRRGAEVVGTTEVTAVELNVELPNDGFTLSAGEGWATEKHELVESE